jgi:hypothetical protein
MIGLFSSCDAPFFIPCLYCPESGFDIDFFDFPTFDDETTRFDFSVEAAGTCVMDLGPGRFCNVPYAIPGGGVAFMVP